MPKTNAHLIRRWFQEVWNERRRESIEELLAADGIVYEGDQGSRGPEGFYPFYDRMWSAFSDLTITIVDTIEEGDRVAARWTATLRHTGDGFGMPATNKTLKTTGISIARVANGKMVEGWQNRDMLGLLQQINEQPAAPTYLAAAG